MICTTESRVLRWLARWYGLDQIEQVERLHEDVWRVRMMDGGVAMAIVTENGDILIREPEAVC